MISDLYRFGRTGRNVLVQTGKYWTLDFAFLQDYLHGSKLLNGWCPILSLVGVAAGIVNDGNNFIPLLVRSDWSQPTC